ncbi:hypothetical protein PHMEG_000842 [Phytophthora megakarya]|uniref:Reverse transcriptase n=1 Tax=Phytophthora megakarya TaxID=4795 RepID=A0A225X4E2_9STRA|nr:hypothetical protein PHMEG_000842 [Phytophthora megakarya]
MSKSTIYSALDLTDGFDHILVCESEVPLTALLRRRVLHNRDVNEKTDIEMHKDHLREPFAHERKHKLCANLKKCIFGASEYPS